MKARRTVASNHVFSLEGGTEDNDLWVSVAQTEGGDTTLASTWELTDEERERIAAGENVELVVFGTSHPPVLLRLTNVPLGKGISRAQVVKRLRDAGNHELAELFEGKSAAELKAEVESWPLEDAELRKEVLAFVMLLDDEVEESEDPEWPFEDEDPPDPL